ncbi:MAG: tRNA preQ1(34) S-adenosylmethionine ribosyltransferase-isomerase QueA [Clostridiales bacterium]|nr:tRNA preQ1(34) S-adenosylmethionine ribosyltransferase-isomerase QueA [Clostridiales bacterium]HBM81276.1 tRNA preQ1(34) S-adenosylmethionine ribosyltransferase-isomerase QueA [Clostridiaceae bacterium]
MKLEEFDYNLPEELIAQEPLKQRDQSRLMILHKDTGKIEHRIFKDIIDYLNPGDCLVLNNTRVMPARLYGRREDTGGKIEVLLLKRVEKDKWEVLVNPGRKARIGERIIFGNGELAAKILSHTDAGGRIIEFEYSGIFEEILDRLGEMPLPHYIKKKLADKESYQTVYSKVEGSAAAPTAGLHFTKELLNNIKEKGISIVYITLHVGLGTFRPVKEENIEEHKMHSEYYMIDGLSAITINECRKKGGRIIAAGTTSTRTLETASRPDGIMEAKSGWTDMYIYPGYKFKAVDCLITNFHLPKSSLIMLVSALAGRERILNAYNCAVMNKYRFYSFGDAMFIV